MRVEKEKRWLSEEIITFEDNTRDQTWQGSLADKLNYAGKEYKVGVWSSSVSPPASGSIDDQYSLLFFPHEPDKRFLAMS